MSITKVETLRVPGANLYYKVRGSGPFLLILQGGDGDAEGSDDLVDQLVDYYTVVTYDRRGLSRSTIDEAVDFPNVETHSDDVHRLLAVLSSEPVFVLGNSIGALIGLDLVARHPEQVRTFVAHEPPAPELLPDAERTQVVRLKEEIEEMYRRGDVAVAMRKNMAMLNLNFNDREPDVVLSQPAPQRAANLEFFRTYDAPAVNHYRLDIAALKAATTRIMPAGGLTSRDTWPHHSAEALADRLGVVFVEFPGGHNGYVLHPKAYAATLRDVLETP